jgi:hypothetical protein
LIFKVKGHLNRLTNIGTAEMKVLTDVKRRIPLIQCHSSLDQIFCSKKKEEIVLLVEEIGSTEVYFSVQTSFFF